METNLALKKNLDFIIESWDWAPKIYKSFG